jgi:hypothetical protein
MVSPGSALISLRKIVRPAPVVGLYRSASTCCWTEELAFMTVAAWPKASEAPNPVIVWNVVAPLIVAVLGTLPAYAGRACAARASVAATATTAAATGVNRLLAGDMTTS